jgi:hypothetical protein
MVLLWGGGSAMINMDYFSIGTANNIINIFINKIINNLIRRNMLKGQLFFRGGPLALSSLGELQMEIVSERIFVLGGYDTFAIKRCHQMLPNAAH